MVQTFEIEQVIDERAVITLDTGEQYSVSTYQSTNIEGYAPIYIRDERTRDTFVSYGYIEINGHTFISKWKDRHFDYYDVEATRRPFILTVY